MKARELSPCISCPFFFFFFGSEGAVLQWSIIQDRDCYNEMLDCLPANFLQVKTETERRAKGNSIKFILCRK